MKGLVIWSQSYCRSTLSFYLELVKCFNVPARIYIINKATLAHREKVGFKNDEFNDEIIHQLDNDANQALDELNKYSNYNHLFGSYQNTDICAKLINHSVANNIRYGVMSEAPCNMEAKWYRRVMKRLYLKTVLKQRVAPIIRNADFILNYSGYYKNELTSLGWKDNQIISCGYYPAPVPGSKLKRRTLSHWQDFTILLTGVHQWHRSPMVLLKALRELDKQGVQYRCIITQEGPLLNEMKRFASKYNMNNVAFLGFIPLEQLIELYENCSVYIGAGNAEPWGMRLNDALQCGAPIIVNRGMGGVKMVDEYGCGLAFDKNDYKHLSEQLATLITSRDKYFEVAEKTYVAAKQISPQVKASEMHREIQSLGNKNWV